MASNEETEAELALKDNANVSLRLCNGEHGGPFEKYCEFQGTGKGGSIISPHVSIPDIKIY